MGIYYFIIYVILNSNFYVITSSPVDVLLSEVEQSVAERCTEPTPMEKSVCSIEKKGSEGNISFKTVY